MQVCSSAFAQQATCPNQQHRAQLTGASPCLALPLFGLLSSRGAATINLDDGSGGFVRFRSPGATYRGNVVSDAMIAFYKLANGEQADCFGEEEGGGDRRRMCKGHERGRLSPFGLTDGVAV